MENHHPLHRRLRAGRLLAGYESQIEFAVEVPGLKNRAQAQRIESGESKVQAGLLISWAEACKLPVEWFMVDYDDLSTVGLTPAERVRQVQDFLDAL